MPFRQGSFPTLWGCAPEGHSPKLFKRRVRRGRATASNPAAKPLPRASPNLRKLEMTISSIALSGLDNFARGIQGRRAPLRYALSPGYLMPRLQRLATPLCCLNGNSFYRDAGGNGVMTYARCLLHTRSKPNSDWFQTRFLKERVQSSSKLRPVMVRD